MDYYVYSCIVNVSAIVFLSAVSVLIMWLYARNKTNETNNRTQLLLTALEKNPNMDMSELVSKMTPAPKQKLLKEKLLTKLLLGYILTGVGLALLLLALYFAFTVGDITAGMFFFLFCGIPLAAGIAFIVNYFVGKKMLAKEMEAEERNMTQA